MPQASPARPELQRYRDYLDNGRFVVSEHVLRSLATGQVKLADMEAAIRRGALIEIHENPRRGVSHLLAVKSRDLPFHAECAEGSNGRLVIVFSYVPAQPVWATPGRRNPNGCTAMDGAFPKCFFCGGGVKAVTVGNFDCRKDGKLYVIKKMPAGLCVECGEKYFEAEVAQRMEELIEAGQFSATETANVIEFDSAGQVETAR